MITIHVSDGIAVKPDDCIHIGSYDPPVGTIIKYIAEDGNEYHIIACDDSTRECHDCVFHRPTGHPLSKLFEGGCGPDITGCLCYDRVYKPIDNILEDL